MSIAVVNGRVVMGQGLGKKYDLPPTMNLKLYKIPEGLATGIYAARCIDLTNPMSSTYKGVVHFGPRPAVKAEDSFEMHCFDLDDDWYGRDVEVELVAYLREVRDFPSIAELKKAIENDIAQAKVFFSK